MAKASGTSTSSMTSTSHTMTAEPSSLRLANGDSQSHYSSYSEYAKALLQALQPENRYKFIQPHRELCEGALDLAKVTLDGFAGEICEEQTRRVQEERKDRKR